MIKYGINPNENRIFHVSNHCVTYILSWFHLSTHKSFIYIIIINSCEINRIIIIYMMVLYDSYKYKTKKSVYIAYNTLVDI